MLPENPSRYLIYGLFDPRTGELRYVGQTCQTPKRRLYRHCFDAVKRGDISHRANWIRQLDGEGLRPEMEVLEKWNSKSDLDDAERWNIQYWRSIGCDLTNTEPGGEGRAPGFVTGKETKKKMSLAGKGRLKTLEHRQRIGEANRGRVVTVETRRKISLANKGRKLSLEQRQRQSDAQKGRPGWPHTEATKRLLSERRKGLRLTQEQRVHWSRAHGGRPFLDQNGVIYQTQREASRRLGISQGSISDVLAGKRTSHKGYVFSYTETV